MSDNKLVLNTSLIQSMGSFTDPSTPHPPASREEKPYKNSPVDSMYDQLQDPKRAHKESKNHQHQRSTQNRVKVGKSRKPNNEELDDHLDPSSLVKDEPVKVFIEKPLLNIDIHVRDFGSFQNPVIRDEIETYFSSFIDKYSVLPTIFKQSRFKFFPSLLSLGIGAGLLLVAGKQKSTNLFASYWACFSIMLLPPSLTLLDPPLLLGASSSTKALANEMISDSPYKKVKFTSRHTLPIYEQLSIELVHNNRSVTIDAHSLKRITSEAQQIIGKIYNRNSVVDEGILRNTILYVSCVIQTYQQGISYACIPQKRIGSMPWE